MSRFLPNKGLFFYVFIKPRDRLVENNDTAVVIRQADGSYRGQVFKCIATDSSYVVGTPVYGGYDSHTGKTYMFACCDVNFFPVGPDVLAALDISSSN